MDPYKDKLIPDNIYYDKTVISGEFVAIMDATLANRNLKLIEEPTRAFRKNDLVEIIATDESTSPGGTVNSIAYIGFIEIIDGGVIRSNDALKINNKIIGHVLGFDATHAPNHYNLIIHVSDLLTGSQQGIILKDDVEFIYLNNK